MATDQTGVVVNGLLILSLIVLVLLAVFGWSLIWVASESDREQEEWLAEDDERRTPNWRRI